MTHILKEIEADHHNLQEMLNLFKYSESKGEWRGISAAVKILVKTIHNQKCEAEEKLWHADETVRLPLFEVEPTPLEGLEEFKNMNSFFGELGD